MKIILELIILQVCLFNKSLSDIGVPLISSCHLFPNGSGPWIKGSGLLISSWLNSLLPANRAQDDVRGDVDFDLDNLSHKVRAVYSDKFSWQAYGDNARDGWIYEEIFGPGLTQSYYVYSNLKSAIRGHFRSTMLTSGVETKIIGFRCNDGVLQLRFSSKPPSYIRKHGDLYGDKIPSFKFDVQSEDFISSTPLLMDPLDRANIRISTSRIPNVTGDALIARTDIPTFSVVVFYTGVVVRDSEKMYRDNMTIDERERIHKNLLSFNNEYDLNVPPPYDNILIYRATLGHKANHSFRPNTKFGYAKNPRFKDTRCLISTRLIKKGEEITINYGYNMKSKRIPRWFRELYYKEFPSERKH